jgi:hypothetical protein
LSSYFSRIPPINQSQLNTIDNLSVEELDRAGGESHILRIVGHHDDRLAFFVEGMVSLDFEAKIPDHGQIILGISAGGGEIIPEDQTIGSRQESKGL